MNTSAVDPIVRAVLYEGHILYPYRSSSIKNRQRFTFGRVYPNAFSRLENGKEPSTMTTECLVSVENPTGSNGSDGALVEVNVRFLQPVERQILDAEGREVGELTVGGRVFQTWQEAAERSVKIGPFRVRDGASSREPFRFAASMERQEIGADGDVRGYIERRSAAVSGSIELVSEKVGETFRIRVTIANDSALSDRDLQSNGDVLLRTFASTHTVLKITGGQFVSLTDPPPEYADAVARCRNEGTWPVLVGKEGSREMILSSPIILYDYPQIAPESAGDFFDSTEIDELLTLRVMTLTDHEKSEMLGADDLARRILQRTESLERDDLFGLHGTLRSVKTLSHEAPPKHVEVEGRRLTVGDRVRIRPKKMTDVMDVALVGKTAEIESIEQDFEGKVYLAVVVDDDPGRDLGLMRQPGHRFFYGLEDVELIGSGASNATRKADQ